eukprot:806933-Alexandrium_andersonii.AAC.1
MKSKCSRPPEATTGNLEPLGPLSRPCEAVHEANPPACSNTHTLEESGVGGRGAMPLAVVA